MGYFDNEAKCEMWWIIANPELRGLAPMYYKIGGKYDILEEKIRFAIKEAKKNERKQ